MSGPARRAVRAGTETLACPASHPECLTVVDRGISPGSGVNGGMLDGPPAHVGLCTPALTTSLAAQVTDISVCGNEGRKKRFLLNERLSLAGAGRGGEARRGKERGCAEGGRLLVEGLQEGTGALRKETKPVPGGGFRGVQPHPCLSWRGGWRRRGGGAPALPCPGRGSLSSRRISCQFP